MRYDAGTRIKSYMLLDYVCARVGSSYLGGAYRMFEACDPYALGVHS